MLRIGCGECKAPESDANTILIEGGEAMQTMRYPHHAAESRSRIGSAASDEQSSPGSVIPYVPGSPSATSPLSPTATSTQLSPLASGSPFSMRPLALALPSWEEPLGLGRTDDMMDDPMSTMRYRYVGKASLAMLMDRLRGGQDIQPEELVRLMSPDRLPDSELLVPVQLDAAWTGGVQSALQQLGGARGAAASLVAARRRCEGGSRSETITAKEWKAITLDAAGVLKPYLLWLVVSTSLGAGVLLNSAADASRRFVMLITLFHIGPEMLLLTYLLLGVPPHGEDHRWKPRIAVRSLYWVCFLILVLAPMRREDDLVVGPLGAGVFVLMAALSDAVCLWLGTLLCVLRASLTSRRLGITLLCHGLAGQIAAFEFLNPDLFAGGTEKDDLDLHGWGWMLMALMTALSLSMSFPIYSIKGIDVRQLRPPARAAAAVLALAVLTLGCQPLLAGAWPDLRRAPSYLPRGPLLDVYKVSSTVGGMVLALYALSAYNDAGQRPLPPEVATFIGSSIWHTQQGVE
mmetsp:Transcript_79345/g.227605  ORF Transcript_79345/g.227605 Transcript_79345/m.227605 type:complete len:518 (-) Transcript_79345:81-1634(-)